MKKIFLFLTILLSLGLNAQDTRPPVRHERGVSIPLIQLDTLTTAQRDALVIPSNKVEIIFNATDKELQIYNGTTWEALGGVAKSLQETTDVGSTTDNNITISNSSTANLTVNNSGLNRFGYYSYDRILFNRDGFNFSIETPTLLGNYVLTYPQLTANDTLALNSQIPSLLNYATLDGNETLTNKEINFSGNTLTNVMSLNTTQSVQAGSNKTFQANSINPGFGLRGVTATPSAANDGDIWYRSDTNRFNYKSGLNVYEIPTSTDVLLSEFDPTEGQSISGVWYFNSNVHFAGGSVNFNNGSNYSNTKITGLANGVDPSDAVNKGQLDAQQGAIYSNTNRFNNVLEKDNTTVYTPTLDYHPATKAYVDANGAGAGDVFKVGVPVDNQIGVWTEDGTIEGTNDFTWDGAKFKVAGNVTPTTDAVASFTYESAIGGLFAGVESKQTGLGGNAAFHLTGYGTNNSWSMSLLGSTGGEAFVISDSYNATNLSRALKIAKSTYEITTPNMTNAKIDAEVTGKILVTKEWVQANAGGGDVTKSVDSDGYSESGSGATMQVNIGSLGSTEANFKVVNSSNTIQSVADNIVFSRQGATVGYMNWDMTNFTASRGVAWQDKDYTGIADLSDIPTLIDDDTFATATSTNTPSSESVKAYVDTATDDGLYISPDITTSTTADLTHKNKVNIVNSNTLVEITIPTNATTAFEIGDVLIYQIHKDATGWVEFVYAGGVTGEAGRTYSYAKTIKLLKKATDEWILVDPPVRDYEDLVIPITDKTTDITVSTDVHHIRIPFDMYLESVNAYIFTAGTTTGMTIDINESGTSILSTKLTTDATENDSDDATTPYVISDNLLTKGNVLSFDFDAVPTGGKEVHVTISGYRL